MDNVEKILSSRIEMCRDVANLDPNPEEEGGCGEQHRGRRRRGIPPVWPTPYTLGTSLSSRPSRTSSTYYLYYRSSSSSTSSTW